jgi:hypothetical protein
MVEDLTKDSSSLLQYRNEKVFNSGKAALELNTSASNGDVNLILTGPSPESLVLLTGQVVNAFQQSLVTMKS